MPGIIGMEKVTLIIETVCLARQGDQLCLLAEPSDPRHAAVERLNAGGHAPEDSAALEGLFVFDMEAVGEPTLMVEPISKFQRKR